MAIVSASKVQDPSSPLLKTLVTSLLTSFNPSEINSQYAKDICATALLNVTQLSHDGYLQGVTATSQILADVISSYTVMPVTAFTSPTSSVYPVETAVRSWTLDTRFCILNSLDSCFTLSAHCMIKPFKVSRPISPFLYLF
jgi:hypothetical protein